VIASWTRLLSALSFGWMTTMSDAIDAAFDVEDPILADDPPLA